VLKQRSALVFATPELSEGPAMAADLSGFGQIKVILYACVPCTGCSGWHSRPLGNHLPGARPKVPESKKSALGTQDTGDEQRSH
jgi:hypothetical protein